MSPKTEAIIKLLISSVVNGLLGSAGIILDNLVGGKEIGPTTIAVTITTGAVLMLKDIQAYLANPPKIS